MNTQQGVSPRAVLMAQINQIGDDMDQLADFCRLQSIDSWMKRQALEDLSFDVALPRAAREVIGRSVRFGRAH